MAIAALFLSWILFLSSFPNVYSMSFIAMDMRNPEKCVMAYYPEDTKLDVLYEILDPKKDKLSLGVKIADSPLSQTKVSFRIHPAPHSTMPDTPENKMRQDLIQTEGVVSYKGVGEGKVHICVRIDEIPGKKYIKPALIAFRVKESGDLALEDESTTAAVLQSPEDVQAQSAAKQHMSEMERILNKMIRDANLLLKSADLIKNDEAEFHKQSVEMNSACRWWPMMHIIVLLVMGFTQANHVLQFFKGKHMI